MSDPCQTSEWAIAPQVNEENGISKCEKPLGHLNISALRENQSDCVPENVIELTKTEMTSFQKQINILKLKITNDGKKCEEKIELAKKFTEEEKRSKELEKSDLQNVYEELEKMNMDLENKNELVPQSIDVLAAAQLLQKVSILHKDLERIYVMLTSNLETTQFFQKNRVEQLFTHTKNGNEAEVRSLIASGADVNAVDDTGKTLLHYAAHNEYITICDHLINKGANVNAGDNTVTPLHLACSKGHLPIIALLVTHDALVDLLDSDIFTPLHYAAKHGHAKACQLLLKMGANVNVRGDKNVTPLHLACSEDKLEVAMLLISHNASVALCDSDKNTPLHYAAQNGYAAVCNHLVSKGANINVENKQGFTPLHWACFKGNLSLVKLLFSWCYIEVT